jgi:hypothetical protein
MVPLANRDAFKESHQRGWVAVWEWLYQGRIDESEDRRAGSDTEREYRSGGAGEAQPVAEQADSETKIAQNRFERRDNGHTLLLWCCGTPLEAWQ